MKVAVCVKEVLDARLPLQVLPETGRIVQLGTEPIKMINPSDRAALEIALVVRSRQAATRVEVFSVCEAGEDGALYFALARGADHVERLAPRAPHGGPPATALALAGRLSGGDFDLICCGDETLDNSSAMVGPLIAELLDIPQVTSVSKLKDHAEGKLIVERKLDRGHGELVEVSLPALLSLRAEAAEPQYVSARRLQLARGKDITVRQVGSDLGSAHLPRWPASERKVPPRARVKKKFAPDANLSAAERVKMIMAGGLQAQSSSQSTSVLEGDPEYLSEQLFRFLRHHEFV